MKTAIIGSGISGLTTAYLLSDTHEVTVFEADSRIGGHTHTVDVQVGGEEYAVDTGFIVFNEKTYPNFIRLMKKLGIAWQNSTMSFSVKSEQSGLEFSPSNFQSLFVQKQNLFRPSFYQMLLDVFRFKKESKTLLRTDDYGLTLYNYLVAGGYSDAFIDHFIIPMGASIWSADPDQFQDFPALYFAEFFKNHGFLNIKDQPQWLTIKGGSNQYIEKMIQPFKDRIFLNSPVMSVQRKPGHVELTVKSGEKTQFDQVVIATHSDQALDMLQDPSIEEKEILGSILFQKNETVLHTDHSILPQNPKAWASWNYYVPAEKNNRVAVTYDMNILQNIDAPVEFCVSLNLSQYIDPEKIVQRLEYDHPVYNPKSLAARKRLHEINGPNRTYFCGAYWGYGFHEDGVNSALEVGKHFNKNL